MYTHQERRGGRADIGDHPPPAGILPALAPASGREPAETAMFTRAVVYAYAVLFGISLLLEHPVPLAIAP